MQFSATPRPDIIRYGASFVSVATIATANTAPQTIVAPGTNTAGVIIWSAELWELGAGGNTTPHCALLAKATAPTTWVDGDVILTGRDGVAAGRVGAQLNAPVFIPPGRGIYYNADNVEQASYRNLLYTVL